MCGLQVREEVSGEFEQLLLACSEGVAYTISGSKFVCYYLCMHTVLTEIYHVLLIARAY